MSSWDATARHREALASAEEAEDPVAGLPSKIVGFRKKQEERAQTKKEHCEWIRCHRFLRDAEAALARQIVQAGSRVLERMQREKKDEDGQLRGVDPDGGDSAIASIRECLAIVEKGPQSRDYMSRIARIRSAVEANRRCTSEDGTRQGNARCADLLLELREDLSVAMGELDDRRSGLAAEIKENKRNLARLLTADERRVGDEWRLPPSLTKAFKSLRAVLPHVDEDDGEAELVELLENELTRALRDARDAHDSVLARTASENGDGPPGWDEECRLVFAKVVSSSRGDPSSSRSVLERLKREMPGKTEREIARRYEEFKTNKANKQKASTAAREFEKRCHEIENGGLKEIELLRKEFRSRSERIRASVDHDLKRRESRLRLQSMRLEQPDVRQSEGQARLRAAARRCEKESERTRLMMETKRTILQHQAQRMEEIEKDRHNGHCREDFSVEIERRQRQQANRERTEYREARAKHRILARKRAEDAASRAEEIRLERLNSLAASVPYHQAIAELSADVHRSTAARRHDVPERNNLPDFQAGRLRSFATERIFSDRNFRLGHALREAGVADTTRARDVVRRAIPRQEARTTGIRPY